MFTIAQTIDALEEEIHKARIKHPPMYSAHEGRSVIREECDELWEHVMKDTGDGVAARKEALQVAAMGIRFATDICDTSLDGALTTARNLALDKSRPNSAHEGHAFIMDEYAALFSRVASGDGEVSSIDALRLAAAAVVYAVYVCADAETKDEARERARANAMQS